MVEGTAERGVERLGQAARRTIRARSLASLLATAAIGAASGSCNRGSDSDSAAPLILLEPAFGGLTFPAAVDLLQHPTDDDRWYVIEQGGTVETFLASDPAGTRTTAVAIGGLLVGGESGLLGMAFHPDFDTTGEAFLSYTAADGGNGTSTIARYLSGDGGLTFALDPGPQPIVLTLAQPFTNHNGGDLDFGPDRYLYVALGDGGGTGDPNGFAQNLSSLFGKILRLDVDGARPYAIPADNPFVGIAGLDEIWAYGLRNPWRMSFDTATGALWVGDVGQNTVEEIDVVVRGGNYGWNLQEGDLLYPALTPGVVPGTLQPVVVVDHPTAESITGGFVYHGTLNPALADNYVFADFVTGRLFVVYPPAPELFLLGDSDLSISSFGQDRAGEIYVVAYGNAPIYRVMPFD